MLFLLKKKIIFKHLNDNNRINELKIPLKFPYTRALHMPQESSNKMMAQPEPYTAIL